MTPAQLAGLMETGFSDDDGVPQDAMTPVISQQEFDAMPPVDDGGEVVIYPLRPACFGSGGGGCGASLLAINGLVLSPWFQFSGSLWSGQSKTFTFTGRVMATGMLNSHGGSDYDLCVYTGTSSLISCAESSNGPDGVAFVSGSGVNKTVKFVVSAYKGGGSYRLDVTSVYAY